MTKRKISKSLLSLFVVFFFKIFNKREKIFILGRNERDDQFVKSSVSPRAFRLYIKRLTQQLLGLNRKTS